MDEYAYLNTQLSHYLTSAQVFIVTGGYTGVGLYLCKILYQKHGTVYIAGRDKQKYSKAIEFIKDGTKESKGRLEFLNLDLASLKSVKAAATEFLGRERRLDVLTNNAGVMFPPKGSKTEDVSALARTGSQYVICKRFSQPVER